MVAIDWTTIGTIASTVALVMGGFLWLTSKIFNLGRMSQRLDAIETDLTESKQEVKQEINAVRTELGQRMDNLGQRMDKLILTIAESQHGKR